MPRDAEFFHVQLTDTEWELRTLVEGIPQLVWRSCDLGRWTWASPQWLAFTGQSQEQTHGLGWLNAVHPDDQASTLQAWSTARPHGDLDVEFRLRRAADGAYVWHRTRSAPVRDRHGAIVEWLGTTTDIQDLKLLQEEQARLVAHARRHARELEAEIQERKRAERELLYTAFHDDLTRLHNRRYFMGHLKHVLSERDRHPERQNAVLVLDLDRFKLVNDSLGHRSGDMLLTVLARRLRACLDAEVTLARIGGDEFGIMAEGITDATLTTMANGVLNEIRRPAWLGERQVVSSCSLGAAWIRDRHRTPEEVLQEADTAMYQAKHQRRGGFRVFDDTMLDTVAEALELQADLRDAAVRSELVLHYQPLWDTLTETLTGFEALVRWQHPRFGLLQPGKFVPLAEEGGLIRGIGRWVLREGCTQLRRWRDQYPDLPLTLNVNVCGEELKDPAFVPELEAHLAATTIDPGRLELEITEGIFLEQSEPILRTMAAVRALGVRIAIDDFGTGYSSLGYLDRLEVDTVKIDRSFVTRMLTQARTKVVLEAVIGLGRALSLRVVAEGVENREQFEGLAGMQCESVQGYLLGRPAPASGLAQLLADSAAARAQRAVLPG